jgi:hypothetical protein
MLTTGSNDLDEIWERTTSAAGTRKASSEQLAVLRQQSVGLLTDTDKTRKKSTGNRTMPSAHKRTWLGAKFTTLSASAAAGGGVKPALFPYSTLARPLSTIVAM